MAFIDIDFIKSLGYNFPNSSVENVELQINTLINSTEQEYLQNTIGYGLTTALYALVEPYPSDVNIFLNGNLVDGEAFYKGIKEEMAHFIMGMFYGGLPLNVNNSGFSSPISDGERQVKTNFVVNTCINKARFLRTYTHVWLCQNNIDFFESWEHQYFKYLQAHSVW